MADNAGQIFFCLSASDTLQNGISGSWVNSHCHHHHGHPVSFGGFTANMGSSSCPGIAEKHCIVAVEFSRLTITVEPVDGKGDREGKPDLREIFTKSAKMSNTTRCCGRNQISRNTWGHRGWNLDIGCVAAAMREVSSQPSEG